MTLEGGEWLGYTRLQASKVLLLVLALVLSTTWHNQAYDKCRVTLLLARFCQLVRRVSTYAMYIYIDEVLFCTGNEELKTAP